MLLLAGRKRRPATLANGGGANFFSFLLPAHKCCQFLISDAPFFFFPPQAFQNIDGDIFTHPHLFLLNMYEGRWEDKTHYFITSRAPLKRSQLRRIYSSQTDQSAAHWRWRNRLRWIHKVIARRMKTKRPLWSSVKRDWRRVSVQLSLSECINKRKRRCV